jgi:hypothetical protein
MTMAMAATTAAYTLVRRDADGRVTYLGRASDATRIWHTPDPRAALLLAARAELDAWLDKARDEARRDDERAAERHREDGARAAREGKAAPKAPESRRDRLARELEGFGPARLGIGAPEFEGGGA